MSAPFVRHQHGVTLIEMMVALLIGSLVVLAVTGIALSNQQTFRSSNSLADIQEAARGAFDLMARDLRQAGDDGCGNFALANADASGEWWQKWDQPIHVGKTPPSGIKSDGSAASYVANTDSIRYQSVDKAPYALEKKMGAGDKSLRVIFAPGTEQSLAKNDYAIICDWNAKGSLVQINAITDGGQKIDLKTSPGTAYEKNGIINHYQAGLWYIGNNGRAGRSSTTSLYRATIDGTGKLQPEEILPGVTKMDVTTKKVQALRPTDTNLGDKKDRTAMLEITLTIEGEEANVAVENDPATGSPTGRIERQFTVVVPLRNNYIKEKIENITTP